MNPLAKLPPGLDPFAHLGPLAPLLEPLVRLLRLPLELLYTSVTFASTPNGAALVTAANTTLGAFVQAVFILFLVLLLAVILGAVLLGVGFGTFVAAAVAGYVARRRRV